MNRVANLILVSALTATACGDDFGGDDGAGDGGDTTPDTGTEPPRTCPPNRVDDPGFEGGSPSSTWEEASLLYESVICDASCAEVGGAFSRTGDFGVWFGGYAKRDVASVRQVLDLPAGEARVRLWIGIDTGPLRNGDDHLEVRLDETVLFQVTEADTDDYPAYTEVDVELPVSAGAHTLTLAANLSGNHITSFFIDDVFVTVCADPTQPPPDTDTSDDSGTTDTSGTGGTTDTSGTGGTSGTTATSGTAGTATSGTGTSSTS